MPKIIHIIHTRISLAALGVNVAYMRSTQIDEILLEVKCEAYEAVKVFKNVLPKKAND